MHRKALFAAVLLGFALYIPSSPAGGQATCTASCGTSTVTCTTSGTCTAVDRNCPTTPGYVDCGGTITSCPPCACTNGANRYTQLASCCYNEVARQCRRTLRVETCINGNWQVTDYVCDGVNCSGACPL